MNTLSFDLNEFLQDLLAQKIVSDIMPKMESLLLDHRELKKILDNSQLINYVSNHIFNHQHLDNEILASNYLL